MKQKKCLSTHGAGYAYGITLIIHRKLSEPTVNIWGEYHCMCGAKGKANPTGGRNRPFSFRESPWKWFKGETKFTEPMWGDWMSIKYVYDVKDYR